MKIRIVKDIEGLKAGDEITLNGHPPATWAGHYDVVQGAAKNVEAKGRRDDDVKLGALVEKLHPLDHDGDGRKGGSLPKAKSGDLDA